MPNRRELLAGAVAVGAVAGCGARAKPAADPPVHDFAQFYLSAHGERVRRAVERHRRGLDRGTFTYLADHEEDLDYRERYLRFGTLEVTDADVDAAVRGVAAL